MKGIKLINGDCLEVMDKMIEKGIKVDAIITSPPYNLGNSGDMYDKKYDGYNDNLDNEEYINFQLNLFKKSEKIINKNGLIIYNINYGTNNTDTIWLLLSEIIKNTDFTIVEQIIWKKRNAIPNNVSRNSLTRICENIFIFSRKSEKKNFMCNKKVLYISTNNHNIYENIFNLIEAKNNDSGFHKKKHKATYSIELIEKLINIYINKNKIILDPFMGSGTTGIACIKNEIKFIGIELVENYFEISKERIKKAYREKEKELF
jgi:DNA modification methylase